MPRRPATTPRPAAILAAASGLLLAFVGAAGYFYSSDFAAPGETGAIFGVLEVNGWTNLLHVLTAFVALVITATAARAYAAALAAGYLALAAWGFALGGHEPLAGFVARNSGTDILHLAVGVAALAALALERAR